MCTGFPQVSIKVIKVNTTQRIRKQKQRPRLVRTSFHRKQESSPFANSTGRRNELEQIRRLAVSVKLRGPNPENAANDDARLCNKDVILPVLGDENVLSPHIVPASVLPVRISPGLQSQGGHDYFRDWLLAQVSNTIATWNSVPPEPSTKNFSVLEDASGLTGETGREGHSRARSKDF